MDVGLGAESEFVSVPEAGIARYLREVGRCRLLSSAEERAFLKRVRLGDREAFKALVNANLKRVVAVCGEYRGREMPMTDLIAEGNLGLVRAVLAFDPDRSLRFTAYAVWCIRRSLESALADLGRLQGRVPPAGIAPASVAGSPATRSSLPPAVLRAMRSLPEPARSVLKLSFGLDAGHPRDIEAIGRIMGTGSLEARQMKEAALRRLQEALTEGSGPPKGEAAGAGVAVRIKGPALGP